MVIGDHTRLTTRRFFGFSGSMFALGMLSVGFGAVDLAMVAPLGVEQVAAVGLGDAVVVLVFAFTAGIIDIFTSRLAKAEGSGSTATRLPVLTLALGLIIVVIQVVAISIALLLPSTLQAIGQPTSVVPLASDYATARLCYGLIVTLTMTVTLEVLKVVGLRNWSVAALCVGLAIDILLNWIVLYGPLTPIFASPASAVAWSTVGTQALMAIFGVVALSSVLRGQHVVRERPTWTAVKSEAVSMGRIGAGVGVRHLNDYVGSTVPFLFMGTLGVQVLAAVTVATRIWTLYCRIPQSCFTSSFIFYNYAVDRSLAEAKNVERRVRGFSAWPTLGGAVLVTSTAPVLVFLLAGSDADQSLAISLVFAFFVGVIPYFFSGYYGELLTAHQEGKFLSLTSTIATYVLVLPLAALGVFVLESAFFAIASTAAATALLAILFSQRYRRLTRKSDDDVHA